MSYRTALRDEMSDLSRNEARRFEGEVCTVCGSTETTHCEVTTAFWVHRRLVAVEKIPAVVCTSCNEQFVDNETTLILDQMRANGFSAETASYQMEVPVFSFGRAAENALLVKNEAERTS